MIKNYALLFGLLIISAGTAFAQESYFIIQTNNLTYTEGDTIVISGQGPRDLGYPIGLQILFEDDIVEMAQITVAKDGSFSHISHAGGPLWEHSGEYLITATYGPEYLAETKINYEKTLPLEIVDDEWVPIDDIPLVDDYDPDVEIQRLQEENQKLREEIDGLNEIIMEQIRVIMEWINQR